MTPTRRHIEGIQAGRSAADELYTESRKDLLGILKSWIPRPLARRWTAEDLFHESFVRALEHIHEFRWEGDDCWRNYLLTIAKNCLKDALKRKSRLNVSLDAVAHGAHPRALVASSSWIPCRRLSRSDFIEEVFRRMKPSDVELVEWNLLAGYSAREMAERRGKGYEAMHKAVQRARKRFAEIARALSDGNAEEKGGP